MSAVLDYVRESVLTAPDDLELHALLPWARGEEPLPASEYRVIDRIVREWWERQTDAQVMLTELTLVDHQAGVRGAAACARWALERYWSSDDRRPWVAVETAEQWCRGEATEEECNRAAAAADAAADAAAATDAAYAAYAATDAAYAAEAAYAAADASYAAAYAAAVWQRARTEALRTLCDVIRAAVQCPPAEVWLSVEVRS